MVKHGLNMVKESYTRLTQMYPLPIVIFITLTHIFLAPQSNFINNVKYDILKHSCDVTLLF